MSEGSETRLRLDSRPGRIALAATILGSGAAFVEMTVVNVAIPAIGRDLGLGIAGLQWVLDGYLLTLSALMLLGGSLGDVLRRRSVFATGLVGFGIASGAAALAPGIGSLVAFRLAQGAAGALLVPNSLAIVD
ncbi:MAG: MFS transporter, partial [Gemmatimonadota bacterium]